MMTLEQGDLLRSDGPRGSAWIGGRADTGGRSQRLRRLFAFLGPAYLVSVGYMDPGNWATDLKVVPGLVMR